MTSNKNGATPTAKAPTRQRLVYVLWAVTFIGLGVMVLLYNLRFWPSGLVASLLNYWPVLLILLGLLTLWAGLPAQGFTLPTFSIDRSELTSAHLLINAGAADVKLAAFAGTSQLMVGQFPAYAGPHVKVKDSQARVELDQRFAALFLTGGWNAALVKGLPWTMSLSSWLGDFDVNLRDLTVTALRLQSALGHADVTLPALGQGELDVRLLTGNLTLRIPDGMAVKLILNTGWLARVAPDSHRFIRVGPGEWVTPNFSAAPHRYTLSIELATGDLIVV
jgi:hypothetical protein